MLPEGVHRVKTGERVYHYWHPHRGTAAAGDRVRIPHDPESPLFWSFIEHQKRVKPETGTLAEMIAEYRVSPKYGHLKPISKKGYDWHLDELERRLGNYSPRDITAPVLLQLQDSMAGTPVNANRMLSVIRTLFKWGVPRGWTATNPAREVEAFKVNSDGADPWPMEMIRLGLEHCRWEAQTFIALAYYTGQRTKDILEMKIPAGNSIALKQSKTGKALTIRIHRDLQPYIEAARRRGFLLMVPGPDGAPLDTNRWRALWTREMAKEPQGAIRVAGLSPHGLRKSAVVALLEADCTPQQVKSITGQSMQMVEHYAAKINQERIAQTTVRKWEKAGGRVLQTPAKAG